MAHADIENVVATLTARGWSARRVAKEMGVSRNTVRGILERLERQRTHGHSALPAPTVQRGSILDEHEDFILAQVEKYPDVTAVRLHEKLTEECGFTGGYTIVKARLREVRPRPKVEPVMRFETDPGEQGQQDWSPYTIDFTRTGRQIVHCFSFVLGFSRRQYIHFCEREDHYTMVRQHQAAFARWDGVAKENLYDNQKVVVLRWELGRPIYNPRFLAFATHYNFRPHALPYRTPEWKGKVEKPFQTVEGNCLNARDFRDLAHLNEHADWWMDHYVDTHMHKTTGERPIDRFAREAEHMLPLPTHPYDTAEVGYRIVSREGFIAWDGTPYAVPYDHVLDLVIVRATQDEIIVYELRAFRIIVQHPKKKPGWREPVLGEGVHVTKKPHRDPDVLLARLAAMGESAASFGAGLCRSQRYRWDHLEAVLALVERYAADDLVAAMERANHYNAFDARAIQRILETTATPRVLPDTQEEGARQRLRDAVGQPDVPPRDLRAYQAAIDGDDEPDPE